MSRIVEKKLIDIFTPHQGNAIYTRKNIISLGWEGDIPVISSDVDNDGILCYVSKHKLQREKDLINYPCITWTVDGMAGTLTARNYPFVPNNHCGWLTPKAEGLDLDYLVFAMQPQFYSCAKNSSNKKVGNNQIEKLIVRIPVKEDGTFDLGEQQRLAGIYSEIEHQKQKLLSRICDIQELLIHIDKEETVQYADVELSELFIPLNGNSTFTKSYTNKHKGIYALYSGNTDEPYEFIDSYDYEGDYLSWAKDGLAGYIMVHTNERFSITGHRSILILKEGVDNLFLPYVKYFLEPIFRSLKKGRMGKNGANEYTTLNPSMVKASKIKIPIPLSEHGGYDLGKQQEIADRYKQIDEIKQGLIDKINYLISISIAPEVTTH